jgi:hypothetical protein
MTVLDQICRAFISTFGSSVALIGILLKTWQTDLQIELRLFLGHSIYDFNSEQ